MPDYGISWDEAAQRELGIVTYDYIQTLLNPEHEKIIERSWLPNHSGKNYGLWFTYTNFLIEQQLGWTDKSYTRQQFLLRHHSTFFVFFIGLVFFYRLLLSRFNDWKFALTGTAMLILLPRIFAHSFFNPKDIILLATFSISIFTMIRFVKEKSLRWAVFHALACGLVVNTRMPGLIIPSFTLLLLSVLWLQKKISTSSISPTISHFKSNHLWNIVGYGFLTAVFVVALSPTFWSSPLQNIQTSFQAMANFDWDGSVLFFGERLYRGELPWYYTLGWIVITTPIIYLLFFVVGLLFTMTTLLRNLETLQFIKSENQLIDCTLLGIFMGSLLAVIIKNSTLYDGWRQLYFLAIPLIGLSVIGFHHCVLLVKKDYLKYSAILLLSLGLLHTAQEMYKTHPSQNVWFNALAGEDLLHNFDVDYWGVCYKRAWEELAEKYPHSCIYVKCENYPCEENYRFIEDQLKDHLVIRYGPQHAELHLSNYRMDALHYYDKGYFPYHQEVYHLSVDGEKIIGAYQDTDWDRWFREELECDVETVNWW